MNHQELIERMRGFEIDHDPNGWPAIQMRDISAMCDAIESLLNALDVAEGEVKRTVAERDVEIAKYRDAPVVAWRYKMIPPGWTYSDQEPNRDFFGDAWNRIQVSALIVKPGE